MTKAFVDTTILVDALLGVGVTRDNARNALKRYTETEAPTFAIKEFALGALANFAWFHNKLALFSFEDALLQLQRMARTPRRYTVATAIQAIRLSAEQMGNDTPTSLAAQYGPHANVNEIIRDRWRLSVKTAIYRAWAARRSVTGSISVPCSCFKEVGPTEGPGGTVVLGGIKCETNPECAMAAKLRARTDLLTALRDALLSSPDKAEYTRCAKVLRELVRLPNQPLGPAECRRLGDAIFAFFAPDDAVILTTNLVDHKILADAVGKQVATP